MSLEVKADPKSNVNLIRQTERRKEEARWIKVSYQPPTTSTHVFCNEELFLPWLNGNLSPTLLFNTSQKERMWFLSSDVETCTSAWIGWKLNLKPGEFLHPSQHTRNERTEFHFHDRSFRPFHHGSPCPSKWNIQVSELGRLLSHTRLHFQAPFMSCIDYAMKNCFAWLF